MANVIDATGLTVNTDADLQAFFTAALQGIYGNDINLDSDTPDGQWVGILKQVILDVEDLLVQIYNSFDPDNAIGVVLDQRVAINGIQRQAGTFTITDVTLVTSQSVNLYGLDQSDQPVFTVADNAGNQWQLQATQLGVAAGTHVFSFQSAVPGAVLTIPNTITVPVTIVLGITSINNPTSYTTLGLNEESDAVLKIRRQKSVSLSSQGYLAGLLAALENINGVTSAFVYENDTGTADGDGVPGHSIWAIIAGTPTPDLATAWSSTTTYSFNDLASSGGINYISLVDNNTNNLVSNTAFWAPYDAVAQAIYAKRNAGCGTFGATSYAVTQRDGSKFIINYDVVVTEALFIKFTATSIDGINPPNIALIRSQLPLIFKPGVFEEVNINKLATYVQQIDPNCLVTNAGFSTSSGGSYTNTLTPAAKNRQFTISGADVIIIPMILSPVTATVTHGTTKQFTGLGGFGTLVYSFVANNSGGSINSSTRLYTAGSAGFTDTIRVTDSLANHADSTVTVI